MFYKSEYFKVKALDVHKIGMSFLFRNCAVQQGLKAGTWSCQTTFSAMCLRDVTHRFMYTFSTGHWVAVQETV